MSVLVLPEKVLYIMESLENSGYEAYAVGGCVRDLVMGRTPHDFDITTSALPQQIKQVFSHTVDTGIAHGTVTVLVNGEAFEVTTYRLDGAYEDFRHPSSVTFTPSLTEDLRRRDFTVNAMAYNPRTGLVDLFGGTEDIGRRLIRCVGNASDRFAEDALRIMRAIRFAAMLDFSIDEKTADAARALADNLRHVSAERIYTELLKLLVSDHPQLVEQARELSITKVILPEYDEIVNLDTGYEEKCPVSVAGHTVETLQAVRPDPVLRLTMLLHDMGKIHTARKESDGKVTYPGHAAESERMAGDILRRLKADRRTMDSVRLLIRWHTHMPPREAPALRHMISEMGKEYFPLYLEVKEADITAGNPAKKEGKLAALQEAKEQWERICADGDPLTVKDLAVSGRDLIGIGICSGPLMGEVLAEMLSQVLDDPARNTKTWLLEHAQEIQKKVTERTNRI